MINLYTGISLVMIVKIIRSLDLKIRHILEKVIWGDYLVIIIEKLVAFTRSRDVRRC